MPAQDTERTSTDPKDVTDAAKHATSGEEGADIEKGKIRGVATFSAFNQEQRNTRSEGAARQRDTEQNKAARLHVAGRGRGVPVPQEALPEENEKMTRQWTPADVRNSGFEFLLKTRNHLGKQNCPGLTSKLKMTN